MLNQSTYIHFWLKKLLEGDAHSLFGALNTSANNSPQLLEAVENIQFHMHIMVDKEQMYH